jgi:hypothetical protein
MQNLLIRRFGFKESDFRMLLEDGPDRSTYPTAANIMEGLKWLVNGVKAGDSLFLHYSGHGSQTADDAQEEADGKDEVLVPMDYQTGGLIRDDMINRLIVRPLPKGARLHAIIDACHSGTMLDLPYTWTDNDVNEWEQISDPAQCGCEGLAVTFSGCLDNQTSADTNAFARSKTSGAMTFCFTLAVESGQATSYNNLMDGMRATLAGNPTAIMKEALRNGLGAAAYSGGTSALTQGSYVQANSSGSMPNFTQVPQLTCTHRISHNDPIIL